MRSLRSVWTRGAAFLLGAGLLAGSAAPSWAGEKIQFSGRNGGGGSTGLNPDRKPAFATPDFLNGPKFGGSPNDGLASPIAVPYVSPPARQKRDDRKDWALGDRDKRESETNPDALLNRLANDRAPSEAKPQTRTERILAAQERDRNSAKSSTTRDALTARSLTNSLERSHALLDSTNRAEPFGGSGSTLTNGSTTFKANDGTIRLPGAQAGSGLNQMGGNPISTLQLKGAGFNSSFIDQNARMEDFKKLLNSRPNALAGAGASIPRSESGNPGKPGGGLPGERGVAELPAMSSQRSGFDFGGSFSGAASGRPTVLNDLNSMRLGAPLQSEPVAKPSEPARREHPPVILQIPKRTF